MENSRASSSLQVVALYCFCKINNPRQFKSILEDAASGQDLSGTLLVANEGINGTIAGSPASLEKMLNVFKKDHRFSNIELKFSPAESHPFFRFKVRVKKEIVTMGMPNIDPISQAGQYVDPSDWNELISREDVIVIDTRNDYEVEMGQFKGAVDPSTSNFQEFPNWIQNYLQKNESKKVAMYCTGGIRCEKATSFVKTLGVSEVYHLKGGILRYLEEVPASKSMWEGECFVFDQRVSVQHGLEKGTHALCHACRWPISELEQKSDKYKPGISCSRCEGITSKEQKKRFKERNKQIALAKVRGERHLGKIV